jgi:hypothetical protein
MADEAFKKHLLILVRAYDYRDLLAMPDGDYVSGQYVGSYKQWWSMTEAQRETLREAVDRSVERYLEEKKKHESIVNQEPAKPDMHVRRPAVRRRCKR